MRTVSTSLLSLLAVLFLNGCFLFGKGNSEESETSSSSESGRLVMFVGVDISGSYKKTGHFKDSIRFLANYIYAHLKGHGGLETPSALFVGSIGGAKPNEPKTFFPIQTFQYKSIPEIEKKLFQIFPATQSNKFTDYNAFFQQITVFVRNKKLVMKPISIILVSDGVPDTPKKRGQRDYRSFNLQPLENLTRNITVRLLYTTADIGMNWQTKVPRRRVRVWTQDANVMRDWDSKDIMQPGKPFEKQQRFFSWIKDNVDFPVRVKRVN